MLSLSLKRFNRPIGETSHFKGYLWSPNVVNTSEFSRRRTLMSRTEALFHWWHHSAALSHHSLAEMKPFCLTLCLFLTSRSSFLFHPVFKVVTLLIASVVWKLMNAADTCNSRPVGETQWNRRAALWLRNITIIFWWIISVLYSFRVSIKLNNFGY